MGNPCDSVDLNLFYAWTTITIGNGKIAPFWDSPWLNGKKPRDIAPLIFDASIRKKWTVKQATLRNAWIAKIKMGSNLTIQHLREYIHLCVELQSVHLREDVEDSILWNIMPNGEYTSSLAYLAQFFGSTGTCMNKEIWKVWATPKIKTFAWLAIQGRLSMVDRLARRGLPNCCLPLCKQSQETASHIFPIAATRNEFGA
jgi:hypothetical protein